MPVVMVSHRRMIQRSECTARCIGGGREVYVVRRRGHEIILCMHNGLCNFRANGEPRHMEQSEACWWRRKDEGGSGVVESCGGCSWQRRRTWPSCTLPPRRNNHLCAFTVLDLFSSHPTDQTVPLKTVELACAFLVDELCVSARLAKVVSAASPSPFFFYANQQGGVL